MLLAHGTVIRAPQAACRATASRTEPRQRASPRALASYVPRPLFPPAPPPLRHCAGQQIAARRLAACRRLPCRVLHHAVALRATALSFSLAPSRQRRLLPLAGVGAYCPPSAPPASLAASSATSTPTCSLCSIAPRPSGGKSQAIQHNSALPKATAPPAAKLLPAWAAARPAGSGNGLLCLAPPAVQLRYSALRVGLSNAAHPWPTLNLWAALPRLWRARWPAAPGSQLVGAVPPALTFGAIDHPVGIGYTDRASSLLGATLVNGWIKSGSACFPECPARGFLLRGLA